MKILFVAGNILKTAITTNFGLNGYQQCRTTIILKRKYEPHLSKIGHKMRKLKRKNYIYDFVEETQSSKQPDVELILTEDVEGIGSKGEVVNTRPWIAHFQLLPSQQAIYASPENLKKLEEDKAKGLIQTGEIHSSPWAPKTVRELSKIFVSVVMNLEEKWELQPWHIRVSFRKAGFWVPEECIKMPKNPICGPDLNKEDKEFYVQVTINNREKVYVRCRIHHWSTNIANRLPPIPDHWHFPAEPLFEEDTELLNSLPLPQGVTHSQIRSTNV